MRSFIPCPPHCPHTPTNTHTLPPHPPPTPTPPHPTNKTHAQVTVISTSEGKREEALAHLKADHFLVSADEDAMKAAAGTLDGIIDCVSGELRAARRHPHHHHFHPTRAQAAAAGAPCDLPSLPSQRCLSPELPSTLEASHFFTLLAPLHCTAPRSQARPCHLPHAAAHQRQVRGGGRAGRALLGAQLQPAHE